MKIRFRFIPLVALTLTATLAFAQSDKKPAPPSADEKAMMDAWMKAMTPGDAHKKLEPFVGTWDVTVKSWMAPGAEPMVSSGTSTNSWILGGRYVEQRFDGTFMGQPYSGLGYVGYDNVAKHYVSTWMDNMSTSIMSVNGAEKSGAFTFEGMVDDPMTGKPSPVKETVSMKDSDHQLFEMWGAGPDGKMFKMMELTYTRKK